MMRMLKVVAAVAAVSMWASSATAEVTWLGANVVHYVRLQIGTPASDVQDTQDDFDEIFEYSSSLQNLAGTSHRELEMVRDSTLLGEMTTDFGASLHLDDAAHGTFRINASASAINYGDVLSVAGNGYNGLYYFSVDRPSKIDLNFINVGSITLYRSADGQTLLLEGASNVGTGDLSFDAAPGGEYYLRFMCGCSGFLAQTGPGASSGSTYSEFSFTISDAVPEPTTWALMIVGFGAAGTMLRRRTHSASAQ